MLTFTVRLCSSNLFFEFLKTVDLILFNFGNFAAETILLAFQHYIVVLGTMVLIASDLVPRMGGDNVCMPMDHNHVFLISNEFVGPQLIFLIWICIWFNCEQGDKARVIQTLLFMAGVNTLLQTLVGTRLPTVMGSSFAFTLPVLSIINDLSDENFTDEHEV